MRLPVAAESDILEAIAALPWVDQPCPFMRHQYAVLRVAGIGLVRARRDDQPQPGQHLAYFRGYQRPNRHWAGPNGLRY